MTDKQPPAPDPASGVNLADELNRDFYSHSPSQYLRTRIALLVALGDADAALHSAFVAGVRAWDMGVELEVPLDDEEIDGFAVVESISIMYLAAEALLRLYFAHVEPDPCPPLKLSSLTSFAKFKQMAGDLLTNPPRDELLREVFRGRRNAPAEVSAEAWTEDADVLRFLLTRAAELLAREANVYNSTKHGLAVQPRKSGLRLGSEGDPNGVIIDHHGSSIRFLSKGPSAEEGVQQWRETIQFAFPSINLAVASALADEIDAIHAVAKARLTGEQGSVTIRQRALIDHLRAVPFASDYTGLLSLGMHRDFGVRIGR